ncbi:MAG: hypothetical protein MUQ56_07160 [Thermoleophilia bacterium]|nr:hypothetical protein [Thermoleophilia bacterium]
MATGRTPVRYAVVVDVIALDESDNYVETHDGQSIASFATLEEALDFATTIESLATAARVTTA